MAVSTGERIPALALSVATVFGIYQLHVPQLADIRANQPDPNVHEAIKTSAWESAIAVSGLSLLLKSPAVFMVGAIAIVAESWVLFWAHHTDPATGKIPLGL